MVVREHSYYSFVFYMHETIISNNQSFLRFVKVLGATIRVSEMV